VAGAIAGGATWSMGQVALEYYDSGKQIDPRKLRQLYTNFYRRFRRENTPDELREYKLEGKDLPLLIEEPKDDLVKPKEEIPEALPKAEETKP